MKSRRQTKPLLQFQLTLVFIAAVAGWAPAFDHEKDDGHDKRCDASSKPNPSKPSKPPCDDCNATGSPVYLASGDLSLSFADLFLDSTLDLPIERYYHSQDDHAGLFGRGWTHSLEVRAIPWTDGLLRGVIVRWLGGQRIPFVLQPDGSYSPPPATPIKLAPLPGGGYRISRDGKLFYETNADGDLIRIVDPNGNQITLELNPSSSCPEKLHLASGDVDIARGANGRIAAIIDWTGRVVQYGYDPQGKLASVTDPAGNVRSYLYDSAGRLTQVLDAGGQVYSITYDTLGRVSRLVDAEGDFTYVYGSGQTTKIDNLKGGSWVYRLDAQGIVTRRTDPLGKSTTLEYDGLYQLVSKIDRDGHKTEYTWSNTGKLLAVKDHLGGVESYSYDANGRVTTKTDEAGIATGFEYDTAGNISKITEAQGLPEQRVTLYQHDARGNLTRVADAENRVTTMVYDAGSRLVQRTLPNGVIETFAYDAAGNLVSETRDGKTTTHTYDASGNKLSDVDPLGATTTYAYDANGKLASVMDTYGAITSYAYDAYGRLTSLQLPDVGTVSWTYQSDGETVALPANGIRIEIDRDQLGQVTRVTGHNPGGNLVETYTYDGEGHETSRTDAGGRTSYTDYDELGRPIRVRTSTGAKIERAYSPSGLLTGVLLASGNTIQYTYDGTGELKEARDDYGVVYALTNDKSGLVKTRSTLFGPDEAIEYNSLGLDSKITYGDGSVLTFTRNGIGKVTSLSHPAASVQMAYDDASRLKALTLADGSSITGSRDDLGQLVNLTDAAGSQYQYAYDDAGRLLTLTLPGGSSIQYGYAGRLLTSYTDGSGQSVQVGYDAVGRPISFVYPDSSTRTVSYDGSGHVLQESYGGSTVENTWDAAGRLLSSETDGRTVSYGWTEDISSNTVTYPSGRTLTYQRDKRLRILAISDGSDSLVNLQYAAAPQPRAMVYGNGVSATLSFNEDGLATSIRHGAGGSVLDLAFAYASNGSGRLLTRTDFGFPGWTEQYGHDARGRLVSFSRGTGGAEGSASWVLDAAGDWSTYTKNGQTQQRLHNALHQIQSINGVGFTHDANGNLTSDGMLTYEYGNDNLLKRVTRIADGTEVARYTYDAYNRRQTKLVGGILTEYVYDNFRVIEEYSNGSLWASYAYLDGLDQPISADIDGRRYFYHRDHLGSIAALTNAAGQVVERYRYTPYGEPEPFDASGQSIASSRSGRRAAAALGASGSIPSSINTRFFTGALYDSETGLYYLRARYYSPALGRFLSLDPAQLQVTSGAENLYAYTGNRPLFFVDPTGLQSVEPPGFDAKCSGFSVSGTLPEFPRWLSRFIPSAEGSITIQYQLCQECCDSGPKKGKRVLNNAVSVSGALSWGGCAGIPWLGGGFGDTCWGVFVTASVGATVSAYFKQDKCSDSYEGGGCFAGGGEIGLKVGEVSDVVELWAGGTFGLQLSGCAKVNASGITIPVDLCGYGKLSVVYKLAEDWWIFSGITGEITIIEGSKCGEVWEDLLFGKGKF